MSAPKTSYYGQHLCPPSVLAEYSNVWESSSKCKDFSDTFLLIQIILILGLLPLVYQAILSYLSVSPSSYALLRPTNKYQEKNQLA